MSVIYGLAEAISLSLFLGTLLVLCRLIIG